MFHTLAVSPPNGEGRPGTLIPDILHFQFNNIYLLSKG